MIWKWLAKQLAPHLSKDALLNFKHLVLEKDKRYMLFLPTGVNEEDLRRALKPLVGDIDMVIIQSDQVKILEI